MATSEVINIAPVFAIERLVAAVDRVLAKYSMRGVHAYSDQNRFIIRHYLTSSAPRIIPVEEGHGRGRRYTGVLCIPTRYNHNGFDRDWLLTAPLMSGGLAVKHFTRLPAIHEMIKPSHIRQLEQFNGAALRVAVRRAGELETRLEKAGEFTFSSRKAEFIDDMDDASHLFDKSRLARIGAAGRQQVRKGLLAMFLDETLFPLESETEEKLSPNIITADPEKNAWSKLFKSIDKLSMRVMTPETAQAMKSAGQEIDALLEEFEVNAAQELVTQFRANLHQPTLNAMANAQGQQTRQLYGWLRPYKDIKIPSDKIDGKLVKRRVPNDALAERRAELIATYPLVLSLHKPFSRINRAEDSLTGLNAVYRGGEVLRGDGTLDELTRARRALAGVANIHDVAARIFSTTTEAQLRVLAHKTEADVGPDIARNMATLAPLMRLVPDHSLPETGNDWQMFRRIAQLDTQMANAGVFPQGRVLNSLGSDLPQEGWPGLRFIISPVSLDVPMETAVTKMMNTVGATLISRMVLRLQQQMGYRWPHMDFKEDLFPLCQLPGQMKHKRDGAVSKMMAAGGNRPLPAVYYEGLPVREIFSMAARFDHREKGNVEYTESRALRELMISHAAETKWPSLPEFPPSWYKDAGTLHIDDGGYMWGWMASSCSSAYAVMVDFISRIDPGEAPSIKTVTDFVTQRAHFIKLFCPQEGRVKALLKIYETQDQHAPYLEFDTLSYDLYTPEGEPSIMRNNRFADDVTAYINGLNAAAIPAADYRDARANILKQYPARNSIETLVDGNPLDVEETVRVRRRLQPILNEDHRGQDVPMPFGYMGFWDPRLERHLGQMVEGHPKFRKGGAGNNVVRFDR
jgi:hypothetical protein